MMARCGHCGALVDTRTDGAEHVATHPPRGSFLERRERRAARESKRYANPYGGPSPE